MRPPVALAARASAPENVTDCFELLEQPRRPWLDPEPLKHKFIELSTAMHPDRLHQATYNEKRAAQQGYTELNAAYNRLREPRERLVHLLELELGKKPRQVQQIPAELMDRFMEVSRLCREADGFLAEKAATTSPLLLAQMFERGQEWVDKLGSLGKQLEAWREELVAQLKSLDAQWNTDQTPSTKQTALLRLEELSQLFGYAARWRAQVQERLVRLSF